MTRRRYDDRNFRDLLRPQPTEDRCAQVLPRRTHYASREAARCGLVPLLDYPDRLVREDELQDVIADGHAQKIFAVYHQRASGVLPGGVWDQNGLPYCWAFGMAMSVMDCRAAEGKEPVRLAPTSLGWLVGWRRNGHYLDDTIRGARERGIAPATHVPDLSIRPREFADDWQDEALKYRPAEWWDTRADGELSMICQCLSILRTGRPLYVAYNWWGHALECCGMEWDEGERHGVVWQLRNSHGERDVIELAGSRGVPDEAYGVRATLLER